MGNSNSKSELDNILNDNIFTKVNISNKDIYYIDDNKFNDIVLQLEKYYTKILECNKNIVSHEFKSIIHNDLAKYNKNKMINGTQSEYLKNKKTITNLPTALFPRLASICNIRYGGNIKGGSKSKKNKSKKNKSKKNKSKKNKSKKNKSKKSKYKK